MSNAVNIFKNCSSTNNFVAFKVQGPCQSFVASKYRSNLRHITREITLTSETKGINSPI